jgi:hypothetical protein
MNRRRLARTLLVLVLVCLALRVCLLAWVPRAPPAPRHTGTATPPRTAPAGRLWQLGGKDATVHFSTWPLSRTKPTTITFQLAGRELDLLKEAMASTTAVAAKGEQVPLRPNRFARVVTVRQSGVTLYEEKDEVTTGNAARMASLSLSSAEWLGKLATNEKVWIDCDFRRYHDVPGTARDHPWASWASTTILNIGPNVPVEALTGGD